MIDIKIRLKKQGSVDRVGFRDLVLLRIVWCVTFSRLDSLSDVTSSGDISIRNVGTAQARGG